MKPLSYTQFQEKYSRKFVATYKGKVVASAKTSKKLFEKIRDKLGDKNLLIHHVDPMRLFVSVEFPLVNKRTSFGIVPDSLIPVEVLGSMI